MIPTDSFNQNIGIQNITTNQAVNLPTFLNDLIDNLNDKKIQVSLIKNEWSDLINELQWVWRSSNDIKEFICYIHFKYVYPSPFISSSEKKDSENCYLMIILICCMEEIM